MVYDQINAGQPVKLFLLHRSVAPKPQLPPPAGSSAPMAPAPLSTAEAEKRSLLSFSPPFFLCCVETEPFFLFLFFFNYYFYTELEIMARLQELNQQAEKFDAEKQQQQMIKAEKERQLQEEERTRTDATLAGFQERLKKEEELQKRRAHLAELKEEKDREKEGLLEKRRERGRLMNKNRLAFVQKDKSNPPTPSSSMGICY